MKTRYAVEYRNKSEWPIWRPWRETRGMTREQALSVAAELAMDQFCAGARVIEYQPVVIWQGPGDGE